ncbi:MAG: T9SS type A sorting domain-containing protein [Bacteroidales bacterium]|nr:T9SS type A sorting domain-containing protein [Bacteroidales bacterium]
MRRKILFFLSLLMLPLIMEAQMQLRRVNPRATPFKMNDGMFMGTKGIMCGKFGAVALTFDEGQHWTTRIVPPYQDFKQVFMEDTAHIWLLTDTLLMHSTDGGLTFNEVYRADPGITFLRFTRRENTSFVLAEITGIFTYNQLIRNNNEWTGASEIINLPEYANTFDFKDALNGLITDDFYIYKTTDGGYTWQTVYGNDEYHFKSLQWIGGDIYYAGGYYWSSGKTGDMGGPDNKGVSYARIWKSTDGGSNWEVRSIPAEISYYNIVSSMAFRGEDTLVVGLACYGEENNTWPVATSFDGGLTWNAPLITPDVTQANYQPKNAWVMASAHLFWGWETKVYHSLFKSNDGIHYMFDDEIVTQKIYDIARNGMYGSEPHTFIINTGTYSFLEKGDIDQMFDTIAGTSLFPNRILDKISFADYHHGMAVTNKTTLVTSDAGFTWQRLDNECLYCSPKDFSYPGVEAAYKLIRYLDVNNPGSYLWKISRSNDQGQQWTDIQLPMGTWYRIIFKDALRGYVFGYDSNSGEYGYLQTQDAGNNWTWYALPTNIFLNRADLADDSILYFSDDYRMFRLILHESGYDVDAEIAMPVGKISAFDFSDQYHGVVVMEDSTFSHVFWTNDGGEVWHEMDGLLPLGLGGVKLCINLLNGYIYGLRNVLIHIDDGLPLGSPGLSREGLSVRPNPASKLTEFAGTGKGYLSVFSTTGQLVFSKPVVLPYKLSISGWENGLYFYHLVQDGQSKSGKFIKVGKD